MKALTLLCWSLSWEDAPLPHIKEIWPANYWGQPLSQALLTHWKTTLPPGLMISASPVKWWDLLRTLSVWMLRQTLQWKEQLPSLDQGFLQLELIDIHSSDDLQQSLQQAGFEKFWTRVVSREKFPRSWGLALFLLTMFGSTYTCESSFSHMNAIKTHNHISLTNQHLQHCLCIALTTHIPDFTALAKSK